jgi:hypothetical protein
MSPMRLPGICPCPAGAPGCQIRDWITKNEARSTTESASGGSARHMHQRYEEVVGLWHLASTFTAHMTGPNPQSADPTREGLCLR